MLSRDKSGFPRICCTRLIGANILLSASQAKGRLKPAIASNAIFPVCCIAPTSSTGGCIDEGALGAIRVAFALLCANISAISCGVGAESIVTLRTSPVWSFLMSNSGIIALLRECMRMLPHLMLFLLLWDSVRAAAPQF